MLQEAIIRYHRDFPEDKISNEGSECITRIVNTIGTIIEGSSGNLGSFTLTILRIGAGFHILYAKGAYRLVIELYDDDFQTEVSFQGHYEDGWKFVDRDYSWYHISGIIDFMLKND